MPTPLYPQYEKRNALLTQLNAVQERQAKLHQQLSDLIAEELNFSRAMIQTQSGEDPKAMGDLVSQADLEFHQRATVITDQLRETHEEIRKLLDALSLLRTKPSES